MKNTKEWAQGPIRPKLKIEPSSAIKLATAMNFALGNQENAGNIFFYVVIACQLNKIIL